MKLIRLIGTAALISSLPVASLAAGSLHVNGATASQLELADHKVTVTIDNQVAITRVVQVFSNTTDQDLTGTYQFRRPKGAKLFSFVTWIDGKRHEGRVFEKTAARKAYNKAVREGHNTALVEHQQGELFTARIHPIKANTTQKIELAYLQLLQYDSGRVGYQYPVGQVRQGSFRFDLSLTSRVPITTAFNSGLKLKINRGKHEASATFSAKDKRLEKGVQFDYMLSRKTTGLDLISFRKGSADGYFMALITPKAKLAPAEVAPKDMTFIIDISGSMNGPKMQQAKQALLYCVRSLKPKDRFNIVRFNANAAPYSPRMLHPTMANLRAAENHINSLRAGGGTNIDAALTKALDIAPADNNRPHIVIFLTDGRASAGETHPQRIIENTVKRLRDNVRLYTFGIGSDLNELMLRRLANKTRGASAFVRDGSKLELTVSDFQKKVRDPILSNLTFDFGKLGMKARYPKDLTFLFAGQQVLMLGRYSNPGKHEVLMRGSFGREVQHFSGTFDFTADSTNKSFLPRLYALTKIQYLLDELDLQQDNSKELKSEVIALSTKYSLATRYTSFLVVTEDGKPSPAAEQDQDVKREKKAFAGTVQRKPNNSANSRPQAPRQLGSSVSPSSSKGAGSGSGPSLRTGKSGSAHATPTAPNSRQLKKKRQASSTQPSPKPRGKLLKNADKRKINAPTQARHRFLASLEAKTLPAGRGVRLKLAYALAQSGSCRSFGPHSQVLATLLDDLDPRSPVERALAIAVFSRSHELDGNASDRAKAQKLLAGLVPGEFVDSRSLVYAALAIDRARRAGLATDTKGFEDAVAGLKGTSLAVQAARRLLGLSVIGKVTPGDLSGDKLFFAAIRLAGSSEAESLRKTISLGYVGQKELSTGINSLLADGALYAYR